MSEQVNLLHVKKDDSGLTFSDETSCYRQIYIDIITAIVKDFNVASFEVFINLEDSPPSTDKKILVTCKKKTETKGNNLCPLWGLMQLDTIDRSLCINVSWSSKYSRAIWRGSTTGHDSWYSKDNPAGRYLLTKISNGNKNMVDAGFTNAVQYVADNLDSYRDLVFYENMTPSQQAQYKYIIVADGNVSTYGYMWVLASGSLALKQESEYIQFFEDGLRPFVHYVPVKNDFSDLLERIKWCKEHDQICKRIAMNARVFVQEYLTRQNLSLIMKDCLLHN